MLNINVLSNKEYDLGLFKNQSDEKVTPNVITIKIIKLLDVKSIVKMSVTCKGFYELLKGRVFVEKTLDFTIKSNLDSKNKDWVLEKLITTFVASDRLDRAIDIVWQTKTPGGFIPILESLALKENNDAFEQAFTCYTRMKMDLLGDENTDYTKYKNKVFNNKLIIGLIKIKNNFTQSFLTEFFTMMSRIEDLPENTPNKEIYGGDYDKELYEFIVSLVPNKIEIAKKMALLIKSDDIKARALTEIVAGITGLIKGPNDRFMKETKICRIVEFRRGVVEVSGYYFAAIEKESRISTD